MRLIDHLQNIKQEINMIGMHGDLKGTQVDMEIAVGAIEYQTDKAIQKEIRRVNNDESCVL